jgi:predicted enzyme related to lactoylglutathione lyase
LNGGDDLAVPLARVEKAGGKVVMPKLRSEKKSCGVFKDTEIAWRCIR